VSGCALRQRARASSSEAPVDPLREDAVERDQPALNVPSMNLQATAKRLPELFAIQCGLRIGLPFGRAKIVIPTLVNEFVRHLVFEDSKSLNETSWASLRK
jgi:hypothetical protein